MFENTTDFEFDQDVLLSSFTPDFSSTQRNVSEKRPNDKQDTEKVKKVKIDDSQISIVKHASNENVKLSDTFNSSAKVIKRKFPGPAGLLPNKSGNTNSFSESQFSEDDFNNDIYLCSQRTLSSFEGGPWNQMMNDFKSSGQERLFEKFNISWIKRNCSAKKLLKAPFLAAVIQSVEIIHGNNPTINVQLKDTTGQIQGTILSSLYEEKSKLFKSGSVIVLKQFGVLTVQNSHCLTITPNSLLVIYNIENEEDIDSTSVKKCVMQQFSIEDIWKEYNEVSLDSTRTVHESGKSRILPQKDDGSCIQKCIESSNLIGSKNAGDIINSHNKNSQEKASYSAIGYSKSSISDIVNESMKNFNFKKPSYEDMSSNQEDRVNIINSHQITVSGDNEHSAIWKDLFEDVDPESLFEEF